MSGSIQNSTPPVPYNIAGPSVPVTVPPTAGEWQAGTVTAVNPLQLEINSGTLQGVTGPQFVAQRQTSGGTVALSPFIITTDAAHRAPILGQALGAANLMNVSGPDGLSWVMDFDAFGGQTVFRQTATGGTRQAPTAVAANASLGSWEIRGYQGTIYGTGNGFDFTALEAFTPTAQGTKYIAKVTQKGTTTTVIPMTWTGDLAAVSGAGVQFNLVPTSTSFANDAAAALGGVAIGGVYRNGSVLQVRIT